MKRVIKQLQGETIDISDVSEDSFIGCIYKGTKLFIASTKCDTFMLLSVNYGSVNKWDGVESGLKFFLNKYECYVFDSAKDLFDWLID